MNYKNPILSGYFPDPSICLVGEYFYMVTSTFEYFPAVPIFRSKNLVNWEQIGYCVTDESYLGLEGCGNSLGIYAPTIRYNNGTFYMTTTDISGVRNFYVTATDPCGPWSSPIPVDFEGIDPSFLFDDDGKVYYMSTSQMVDGLQTTLIGEIDITNGKLIGEKRELWAGTGGRFPEAPHVYKKDGYYYVMLAEGGTAMGHMVTMARSKDVFGPYTPCEQNPIYTHREIIKTDISGTGHMDLVEDNNGNWWAVFLGFRMKEKYFHHLGRESFLAPVTWNEGEFPVINDGRLVEIDMQTDKLPAEVEPVQKSFVDEFKNNTLDFRYMFLRKPSLAKYNLDNGLTITGNTTNLDTLGTPSFIGFRQTDFNCEVYCHVKADFNDDSHVGLTAFYDNTRHFDIYISKGHISVNKTFDDLKVTAYKEAFDSNEVVLCIKANETTYSFGYGETEELASKNVVATGLTRHLSTEVSIMSFTGVFFGMYVDNGTKTTASIKKLTYNSLDV